MTTTTYKVTGMTCEHCVRAVTAFAQCSQVMPVTL